MRSRSAVLFGVLLACGLPACLGAEGITRRAVPAALDEGVKFFEDPETQQRIERLLLDPEVQNAARELGAVAVRGAIAGATDEASQAALRQASTRYVRAVAAAAADSLRADLGPAAAESADLAVRRVLRTALSSETGKNARALVRELTRATVESLTEAAARGLQKDLGPALRAVLEDELGPALRTVIARDIAPALREAMAGELLPAIGLVARESTRQIVLGADEGLAEIRFRNRVERYEISFWDRLNALLNKGIRYSTIAAWGLGVVVIVLGVLFGRAIVLRRRLDEERLRSERMLLGVMRGLQQGSDKPDIEALLAHLRERDPDLADDTFLDELARRVSGGPRKFGRPRRRM